MEALENKAISLRKPRPVGMGGFIFMYGKWFRQLKFSFFRID